MDNEDIFQKIEEGGQRFSSFKDISEELSKIWNYSWIPIIIEKETFYELRRANELALKVISGQYREAHYENISHPFTQRISMLNDPEISIIPFRIDYLKRENGTYAMYDLNTQPGTPGSFFWEEFWQRNGTDNFPIDNESYEFFRIFPVLGRIFKKFSCGRPKVTLFQEPDPVMDNSIIGGLSTTCTKASSYGYYDLEFILEKKKLCDCDVIEPFYFIRGDLSKVFLNYEIGIKENKPLGSNLKLEPYTSKDMAFANSMESYLDSDDSQFLKARVAPISHNGGVKKRLYGMSGTGYYDGNNSIPWSDELVRQERLFPERCLVSMGKIKEMMYDIGITSLLVFKGRELTKFIPVVDITVRAKESHPISGPDTHIVPAAVEI